MLSSIISPASRAPCLVAFPHPQAFCSTNPPLSVLIASPEQLATAGPPFVLHLRTPPQHPPPRPGALVAHIGMAVTEEEMRRVETGGNVVVACPPLPAAGAEELGGGHLPPYKSLLGWTSAPGRGRVKPQPSSVFSLQHPPSPHSQQLSSSGCRSRLDVACPE